MALGSSCLLGRLSKGVFDLDSCRSLPTEKAHRMRQEKVFRKWSAL